ncbi:MAG: DnaJ C-terminal domain-containing protein [Endozoicomonas sp.]
MEFKDYYKILGVEADANDKTIKAAYRKLARKYHPDVSDQPDAESQFKEIAEAYEVLKDGARRAEYDELRTYGGSQESFRPPPGWQSSNSWSGGDDYFQGDFSDFFSSMFGSAGSSRAHDFGRSSFSQRGQDLEKELPIVLEDTQTQESKAISYSIPQYDDHGHISQVNKTLNVKIPVGVSDGEQIRLKGQGAPGIGGAENGDLYLRIRFVPHPFFDVEGHNLIITLPISPWEAALGTKVTIPTLSGKINMTVPADSQSGQRLRVKGKGLHGKKVQGDLYALLKIVIPENNESIKEQWQKLAELAPFNPRAEWS